LADISVTVNQGSRWVTDMPELRRHFTVTLSVSTPIAGRAMLRY